MTHLPDAQRQLLAEPIHLSLRNQFLERGLDESLGKLHRGIDLDADGGARVEDRDCHGQDGGK